MEPFALLFSLVFLAFNFLACVAAYGGRKGPVAMETQASHLFTRRQAAGASLELLPRLLTCG